MYLEVNVAEPVSVSETVTNKENDVLTKSYSKLISTLTDIDSLLAHFVENKIIRFPQEGEILAHKLQPDKVKALIRHIQGPLEGGDTKGFYCLLEIMKSKGKQATKDLAENMEKSLSS